MRIVITSGGTAGHIYPALAVARELITAGHEVFFAGTTTGQETELVKAEAISYTAFDAIGFNRSKPSAVPSFLWHTTRATTLAKKWLAGIKPDAVIGFGSYASVPVCRAAGQSHIPILIHEQNSTAGWANRLIAQNASGIALTYEQARAQFARARKAIIEVTGNPVRQSLLELDEPTRRAQARQAFRDAYDIPADALVLLVFGGSQGARSINDAVIAHAQMILAEQGVHVVHITGPKQFMVVKAQIVHFLDTIQAQRWHAINYCSTMGEAYVACDLVVSRAGASSLAEIAALGVPALLVPYPYAADDHQSANARSLVETGAARCVSDSELENPIFIETLLELLHDRELRESMATAARAGKAAQATQRVIDLLMRIATKG